MRRQTEPFFLPFRQVECGWGVSSKWHKTHQCGCTVFRFGVFFTRKLGFKNCTASCGCSLTLFIMSFILKGTCFHLQLCFIYLLFTYLFSEILQSTIIFSRRAVCLFNWKRILRLWNSVLFGFFLLFFLDAGSCWILFLDLCDVI